MWSPKGSPKAHKADQERQRDDSELKTAYEDKKPAFQRQGDKLSTELAFSHFRVFLGSYLLLRFLC